MVAEKEKKLSLAEKLKLASVNDSNYLEPEDDLFEGEEYMAFLLCRGSARRAETLNLAYKNGVQEGLAFSHLYRIRFDPSRGIEIEFSDHEVIITGIRLLDGYRRILSHRVLQVTEADQPTATLLMPTDKPIVTEIKVRRREPGRGD
jgi:hypothetical protein